ncbi:MAG: rod shape-determining protein MreC, partial [Candidatus Neomarinimicrobiota bacterium]
VRHKHHYVFVITIVLSFLLLFNQESPGLIKLRQFSIDIISWVSFPITNIKTLRGVEEKNQILREKNLQLVLQLQSLLHLAAENNELRKFLNFQRESNLIIIAAEIVNKGSSPNLKSILIDVGKDDNINPNLAVITPDGIVGKTVLVAEHSTLVQLISDVNFRISVHVLPSGAGGILRWKGDQYCDIREVHLNAEVNIGDQVVTSGYSDIFPKGLKVGTVTEVIGEIGQFQKSVTAKIDTDLGSLMNVFVILSGDSK